jgi:DNA excision repair protein ERCC-1
MRPVLVSPRQQGNPLLKLVRNVPWQFDESLLPSGPDFVVGAQACVLFLSLRYHLLHPKYIFARCAALQARYTVRVLLVLVDLEDNERSLLQLTGIALANQWTMLCAWSMVEAARYVESLRSFENNSAAIIKEKVEDSHFAQISAVLLEIRSLNRTDVVNLAMRFKTLKNIANASTDELVDTPGIGDRKARRIHDCFRSPLH